MGAIIKAINTNNKSRGSTKALKEYLDKEKSLKTGIDCNSDNWEQDFSLTKSIFSKTEGRQYKHFAQSFEKGCKLTPEEIHQSGLELVKTCKQFKGFQAVVITHLDKDHLHNHIVINSVNSVTGKKLQLSNSNLKTMKKNMNNYLKQNFNIEPTMAKKGIVKTQHTKTYKVLEKALEGKTESFMLNLTKDIKVAIDKSIDQDSLKKNLNDKNIKLDISNNHEILMFTSPGGKNISSKKINEIFGINFNKKSIDQELELNKQTQTIEKVDYTNQMMISIESKEKILKEKQLEREKKEKLRKIEWLKNREIINSRGFER